MTRFIYLSDTHLGANAMGYQQQPALPERLDELVVALRAWIGQHGEIDFVLHGGDMVDTATEENIRRATELFRLGVPVYLCLGNHDLTDSNALTRWLTNAPDFFPSHRPNFAIDCPDCRLLVVPNQWCGTPYYWKLEQDPHFTVEQLQWLAASAVAPGAALQIFVTHSPVVGAPPAQTGFDDPFHSPAGAFSRIVFNITKRHAGIRCVLSGHNHLNTCVKLDGVRLVTASAFVEAPFEFKLFEVDAGQIRMSTISLQPLVTFKGTYDYDKTYVQGRPCDRAFGAEPA